MSVPPPGTRYRKPGYGTGFSTHGTRQVPRFKTTATVDRVKNTTLRILKDMVSSWFFDQLEVYFPEWRGNLIASYRSSFYRGLAVDDFIVESDLIYANRVERLGPGTNWTKKTTRAHAARTTFDAMMNQIVPRFLQIAFQQAIQREYSGVFTRF